MPVGPQKMMKEMKEMMQHAEMDPLMMKWCMIMMRTPIFLDSPAALRGQAEDLGLSYKQVKELLDIENEARQKAKSVLTEEQIRKIGEVPEKPMAMMEMCTQMGSKMMSMMQWST